MISRFAWGTCIRWIDFISRYNWTICITAVFLHILYIDNNKSYLLNLPCVYHIHCTRNVNQSSWTALTLNDPVIFFITDYQQITFSHFEDSNNFKSILTSQGIKIFKSPLFFFPAFLSCISAFASAILWLNISVITNSYEFSSRDFFLYLLVYIYILKVD